MILLLGQEDKKSNKFLASLIPSTKIDLEDAKLESLYNTYLRGYSQAKFDDDIHLLVFDHFNYHHNKDHVSNLIPCNRLFIENNINTRNTFSIDSSIFDIDKIFYKFGYEILFNTDKDCPIDHKLEKLKVKIINESKDILKEYLDINEDEIPYNDIFTRVNSPFYGSIHIGNCIGLNRKFTKPMTYYMYELRLRSFLEFISRYFSIKNSLDILQTEFRVNDIKDNITESFIFEICINIKNIDCIKKDKHKEDKDENVEIDKKNKKIMCKIDEDHISEYFKTLFGFKIPEPFDKNANYYKNYTFKFLNSKFRFVHIPSNPMKGFIVPKSFLGYYDMIYDPSNLKISIELLDKSTSELLAEFPLYPTKYTGIDILSNMIDMLDILSYKYDCIARSRISINDEKYSKREIISMSRLECSSQQNPLERLYELLY